MEFDDRGPGVRMSSAKFKPGKSSGTDKKYTERSSVPDESKRGEEM